MGKAIFDVTLGVALSIFSSVPASAATYVGALYGSGTWFQDYDDSGRNNFNPGGFGDFAISFVIDTTKQTATISLQEPEAYYYGPTEQFSFSTPSSPFTFTDKGGTGSFLYQNPGSGLSYLAFDFQNAPKTLGSMTGDVGLFESFGSIVYDSYDEDGNFIPGYGYSIDNELGFTVTSGFVSASGAPEPATWALMILGFGSLGVMMRRQRASARLAFD